MAVHPAMPMAPPWIVGSQAKATAVVPSIRPTPTRTPLSSSGVMVSRVPSSNKAVSRARGERGSSAVSSGEVVVNGRPFSGRLDDEYHVGAPESEGVGDRGTLAQRPRINGHDVEIDVVVAVVEVQCGRHDVLGHRQQGGD